ncbi:hypothetical protein [Streptomyces sp. NPDC002044]|uniref:hypothetical protein n=1 Tax=Streptomyces sp. NPDC002044 TaxID=3154662 RepID=UPI0033328F9F
MLGTIGPGAGKEVHLAGRGAWDTFAALRSPAAVRAEVPYATRATGEHVHCSPMAP